MYELRYPYFVMNKAEHNKSPKHTKKVPLHFKQPIRLELIRSWKCFPILYVCIKQRVNKHEWSVGMMGLRPEALYTAYCCDFAPYTTAHRQYTRAPKDTQTQLNNSLFKSPSSLSFALSLERSDPDPCGALGPRLTVNLISGDIIQSLVITPTQ